MSKSTGDRVISTIIIAPSAELLTALSELKAAQASGGLLKAMDAAAANDSNGLGDCLSIARALDERFGHTRPDTVPKIKQMGQWVFEGVDKQWVSAHVDADGSAYYARRPISELETRADYWGYLNYMAGWCRRYISHGFDASAWRNTAINRETVNDVDYLTASDLDEGVPHIDDVLDQPNWLSESAPAVTDTDLQVIFIKNLSSVLIQRMHSMGRFSDDDYDVGGNDLKAWDIVVNSDGLFGIAVGALVHHESHLLNRVVIAELRKTQDTTFTRNVTINHWRDTDVNWYAITEAALPAFRAALEACYA